MSSLLRAVTLEDLVAAVRRQQAGLPALAWRPPDAPGSLDVCVHGAHPEAGASTVAVALVDALDQRGVSDVTLVDLAPSDEFGASEAIQARADFGLGGWTGGRRGATRLLRMVNRPEVPDDVVGNVVIDAAPSDLARLDLDVLVCRATVPGVRRAEAVLMEERARVVAVVGASKWPSPVRTSLGPHLHAAWASGGVVFFPHESVLEVNGLSAEPLATATVRAAGRLLDFLAMGQIPKTEANQNGDLA